MASILRQIVAGPRARHPEAGLDLCYVTDNIIATSGPGATYPQVAYRNPLKDLVKFLDSKHEDRWAIWEFRAEGTGYPDSEVYGRVRHYPWPDHHPPPFALIPLIMGSMRNWLKGRDAPEGRVVVVHCKAGKGRSGTVSVSYLISEEGWNAEEAMRRFTERRMRPGFGAGISIPSQQRWVTYVDRWTKGGKIYVERAIEVLEVHVWGLRDGVKIVVEGYVEEGKKIKKFHTFSSEEREIVRGSIKEEAGFADVAMEIMGKRRTVVERNPAAAAAGFENEKALDGAQDRVPTGLSDVLTQGGDVVFRPSSRVVVPTSDINMDFERRNNSKYGGLTMVTSVAHVWFNAFFEGRGAERNGEPDSSGVFEIEWDAMDGIKGSSRKGTRAFDKLAVVWKAVELDGPGRQSSIVIKEPDEGEEVRQTSPADWRGTEKAEEIGGVHQLGLRPEDAESRNVSRANSVSSQNIETDENGSMEDLTAVRSHVLGEQNEHSPTTNDGQMEEVAGTVRGSRHLSTADLPDGRPESELTDHQDPVIGSVKRDRHIETSS